MPEISMADSFNPYAPPAAELDKAQQVGTVARDGNLVRMDRNGQLPDRCVGCNAAALPDRVTRTLYWASPQWRLFAWGLPILMLLMGVNGLEVAGALFMPVVLVLFVANMIIRKRFGIEIGLCRRHLRNRRTVSILILISCAAAVVLPFVSISMGSQRIGTIALVLLGLFLAFGLAHAFSAANRIGIKRLSERHVWLKGAGAPFRLSLPEAAPE